jgi:uracil-DNA glycosylase family 4
LTRDLAPAGLFPEAIGLVGRLLPSRVDLGQNAEVAGMAPAPETQLAFDIGPQSDCQECPRLAEFRRANQVQFPDWRNAPVPSFGPSDARLAIIGLAPGLRGANRTGRPFTGDYAGDLLYATLLAFGFASGEYDRRPDDGLQLQDCAIVNAVRCVPPQNKPTPLEIATCRRYLIKALNELNNLRAIVVLGRIAHDTALRTFGLPLARFPFAHGARHDLPDPAPALFDSYHCSRYNTNTGVLTPAMFRAIFASVKAHLAAGDGA